MSSNFLLSVELIKLMGWLTKNEKAALKLLIKKAIVRGLGKELETVTSSHTEINTDQVHDTFVNFLVYLEETLLEALQQDSINQPLRESLLSAIQDLKVDNIDTQTLWTSVKQTERELTQKPVRTKKYDTKKMLLENIFKNWNPTKKEVSH
jgi:hypothetical protein